jgi:hypothetical protein
VLGARFITNIFNKVPKPFHTMPPLADNDAPTAVTRVLSVLLVITPIEHTPIVHKLWHSFSSVFDMFTNIWVTISLKLKVVLVAIPLSEIRSGSVGFFSPITTAPFSFANGVVYGFHTYIIAQMKRIDEAF